jgi:hypothetical protein
MERPGYNEPATFVAIRPHAASLLEWLEVCTILGLVVWSPWLIKRG